MGIGNTKDQNSPQEIEFFKSIKIEEIYSGGFHCLALSCKLFSIQNLDDHIIYSWGRNYDGQLGLGYKKNEIQPKEIESLKNIKIYDICVGDNHSMILSSKISFYNFKMMEESFHLDVILKDDWVMVTK